MILFVSKVFSVVLAIVAVSKSYVDFRTKRESFQVFLLWTLAWIGIVFVALYPRIVDILIRFAGGENVGLGTFFGMAMVFLFYLVYRLHVRLDRMSQQIATLVQALALDRDLARAESGPNEPLRSDSKEKSHA